MKLDTPLPPNTKSRPPMQVWETFVIAGTDLAKNCCPGETFSWAERSPWLRLFVERVHDCGAVECRVVEGGSDAA